METHRGEGVRQDTISCHSRLFSGRRRPLVSWLKAAVGSDP